MKKKDIIRLVKLLNKKDNLERDIKEIENWLDANKGEYDLSLKIDNNKAAYDTRLVDYAYEFLKEYKYHQGLLSSSRITLGLVKDAIEEM